MTQSLTYADAGVDIEKANSFVKTIKKIAEQTPRTGVMGEIGGFGGLFSLNLANYKKPVLVSSTDGVGTKLKIAFMMDKHDTIGIDLVGMCVNDIIVQGAKTLFFLDYLSIGKLDTETATQIVRGIAEGCKQANCALIGGETAEMPDIYEPGEYDLAGFSVGLVDNSKIIDGSDIKVGHKLIGIASSGLHSNGYSLVRKICFEKLKLKISDPINEFGQSLGEELLTPTRIYSATLRRLIKDQPVHGLAHITGGGITDNIVRILPKACTAEILADAWPVPPIFPFLQKGGNLSNEEMLRTFNNGIGMIAVVPEETVQEVVERLQGLGEQAHIIGQVVDRKSSASQIEWVQASVC